MRFANKKLGMGRDGFCQGIASISNMLKILRNLMSSATPPPVILHLPLLRHQGVLFSPAPPPVLIHVSSPETSCTRHVRPSASSCYHSCGISWCTLQALCPAQRLTPQLLRRTASLDCFHVFTAPSTESVSTVVSRISKFPR